MTRLQSMILSPMGRRVLWVLFAVIFFQSGLAFTTWLLEPQNFDGGMAWLWVALFPILLPAFFFVNRHLGCATGACASGRCGIPVDKGVSRAGTSDQETNPMT